MPAIAIKEWLPDAAALANPGAIDIRNAVPGVNSHQSVGQLVESTNALGGRPRGAIEAKDASGNVLQYAGDVNTLYELSGSTWTDVSLLGGYATGTEERWEFVRWKNKALATNFSDDPQQITFGAANFSDLTTALRSRHIAVVREFVVHANTFDGTDGEVRDRVRWSGFNDELDYVVSPVTLSDFRDLGVGGAIQRVFGGQYGVILSEQSSWRMTWAGAPRVFEITEEEPGIGTLAPGAATRLGDVVYLASEHGFHRFLSGTTMEPIGAGKIDKFFARDLDLNNVGRMSSVADPRSRRIYWAYPGAGNTAGRPNRIMVYDTVSSQWAVFDQEIELIWRSGGIATTLEQLDAVSASLDDLGVSLDSSQWKGGAPLFSGFSTTFASGNFSGEPMTATIETRETELVRGRKAMLARFKPLVDGQSPNVTAQVGFRNNQGDGVVWGPNLTLNNDGIFTTRTNARFFRFRLNVSGDWDDIIGVQIDEDDFRAGSRRG